MKTLYQYILLISLFFFSCQKDSGPTTVEGIVLEHGSNKAVPFARVELMREKGELFSSALNVETVQTIQADGEGKFNLHFDADEDYIYGVRAIANGFDQRLESVDVEKGRKNKNLKVILYPFGYLKYHIKNVKKESRIKISEDCFDSDYFNENTDTIIICKFLGGYNHRVSYYLYKNLDTQKVTQEILIPAHDTASITIEY